MNSSLLRAPWTISAGVGLVVLIFLSALFTNYTSLLTPPSGNVLAQSSASGGTSLLGPVVFALVMMGEDSAREGANAIKTALMQISRPVEFHILCSQDAIPVLQRKFELFSRPMNNVHVNFYLVDEDAVKARAGRSGVGTTYPAGWGGMLKVFMHELLVDVDRAIFFDTDMMFLVDPYILWRQFDNMNEDQIVSFPTIGPKSTSPFICSCIMLLNFAEMRKRTFMSSSLLTDAANAQALGNTLTWEEAEMDPMEAWFGDQGLYWAIWKRHPQNFMHLSESWDISLCRDYWNVKLDLGDDSMSEVQQIKDSLDSNDFYKDIPERHAQIFPGIVHFNCHGEAVWESEDLIKHPSWGPYVTVTRLYKWVWLNRGDGSANVTISIKKAATFYDELIAGGG